MSDYTPNEKEWQATVVEVARLHGWATMHQLDSRGTEAGWPDLVLLRPPELLIVELKSERGKVTQAQERWLADLSACGVETSVWRPSNFDAVCTRLARRGREGAKERPLRALPNTEPA